MFTHNAWEASRQELEDRRQQLRGDSPVEPETRSVPPGGGRAEGARGEPIA